MTDTAIITEHMDAVGSDGHHVGRVYHLLGQEIELAKLELGSGLKHRLIQVSWVDRVGDKVHPRLNRDEAKTGWRESIDVSAFLLPRGGKKK